MNKITFSIITPTYNRATTGLLEEAMVSVKSQKPGDFDYEHIIVDDGSKDKTPELLKKLSDKNEKVVCYRKVNGGTPSAIKYGVSKAGGNYVIILNDDDLLPQDSLYQRAKYIEQNPGVDWFYGKTQWVGNDGEPVKTWTQSRPIPEHPYESMLAENFIQGGTTTFKKDILDKINWPDWLKTADDDFIAKELLRPEHGYKLGYLDEVLFKYRRHERGIGMQSTRDLKDKKSAEVRRIIDDKIRGLHPPGLAFLAGELGATRKENRALRQQAIDVKARLSYKIWEQKRDHDLEIKYLHNSRIVGPAIKLRDFIRSMRQRLHY